MGTVDRSSWHRHLRARRNPLPVGLESHTDPVVVDPQVSVPAAHNGLRRDFLHFLRQYADIDLVRAIVGKPIKSDAVAQIGKTNNVVLERNIGPPSAAPASTSKAPPSEAAATEASSSEAGAAGSSEPSTGTTSHARRRAMGRSVSHSAGGTGPGGTLMGRTARLGASLRLAGLLAPAPIGDFLTIGRSVLAELAAIPGLENLLTAAAAEV